MANLFDCDDGPYSWSSVMYGYVGFLCYQVFRCCSAFSVFMYENKRTITDSLALFY